MIGFNSGGGVSVCKVFLTKRDEVGSFDHTCTQIHTINKVKNNKQRNKQKRRKNQPSLY